MEEGTNYQVFIPRFRPRAFQFSHVKRLQEHIGGAMLCTGGRNEFRCKFELLAGRERQFLSWSMVMLPNKRPSLPVHVTGPRTQHVRGLPSIEVSCLLPQLI